MQIPAEPASFIEPDFLFDPMDVQVPDPHSEIAIKTRNLII